MLLPVALIVLTGLTVRQVMLSPSATMYEFAGETMGTTYSVKVEAEELSGAERKMIGGIVSDRLREIEGLMSTYDSLSEVSRFNRHRATTPFPLSAMTLAVLEIAREVSERSDGALDVTVAPVVNAWGFGPNESPGIPTQAQLAWLKTRVGYRKLHIDIASGTVTKANPDVVVDLSAVAKGFAVDHVAEGLRGLGLGTFLVEVGGELRAGGRKRDGEPWRVGVEEPDPGARRVHDMISLVNASIATSGDYRNFFDIDGVRYGHIVDPRSGRTVRYTGASVSVIHRDAAVADAWATALTVLGPQDGYALAEREGVAALFLTRADSGFTHRATTTYRARFMGEDQRSP